MSFSGRGAARAITRKVIKAARAGGSQTRVMPVDSKLARLPDELKQVICKMTRRLGRDRHQTFLEVEEELLRIAAQLVAKQGA